MKQIVMPALLLACCCGTGQADLADPYFTGNPWSPYPPGCITLPTRQIDLYGDNVVRFWSGSMWLEVVAKVQSTDVYANMGLVYINMYRVGCAEPNRSVIVAEFTLPQTWVDPRNARLVLPSAGGSAAWDPVPFDFRADYRTAGDNDAGHRRLHGRLGRRPSVHLALRAGRRPRRNLLGSGLSDGVLQRTVLA
jgi:hypothetical protein